MIRTRELSVLVAAGALLTSVVTAGPASANSEDGPVYGYESLCMDDRGNSINLATPVQMWACSGSDPAEVWTLDQITYTIRFDEVADMCLDINDQGTTNGTAVQLYQCNGLPNQIWVPRPGGALENPASGKCLDDTAWGGSGTPLELYTCNGGANQDWTVTGTIY